MRVAAIMMLYLVYKLTNMKVNIKSTLEKIANQVFTAKSADEAKQIIVSHISDSQVNDIDKNKMITDVNALKNLVAVQRYLANALLKYEGLGTGNVNKTAKQAAAETENE
jgi:proteasome assembly chaperone (PAC2) family protein